MTGKPNDITYTRERKSMLASMGHDVGEISKATQPNRHHGCMARRKLKDKLTDSLTIDTTIERMRNKQILDATAQNKVMIFSAKYTFKPDCVASH